MTDKYPQPPQRASRILRTFCPGYLLETVEGDLHEEYQHDVRTHGLRRARRKYYLRVLSFFRPGILLRNHFGNPLISRALIRSHLLVTIRGIRRQFGYAFINIFGLAMGVAACLLIFCYTRFQQSFDDFHPAVERTYRVNQTAVWTPEGGVMGSTALPLAERLVSDYPEIEATTRINTPGAQEVRYEATSGGLIVFQENDILAADSNFFEFFDIRLAQGDPATALHGQNKVVITPATARRYFGEANALGRILLFGEAKTPVEVTGVTEPLPRNMHFDFDLLISMHTNPDISRFQWSWVWTQVATYARLRPDADPALLEPKFRSIQDDHVQATFTKIRMDYDSFIKGKGGWNFYLQPVPDIHLHSQEIGNRLGQVGNAQTVSTFQVLALLILLIAMINFVNLATARASKRAREIGVKKAIGALRSSLVTQFQIESVFITLLACLLSIPVLVALSALLFRYAGVEIPMDILSERSFLLLAPLVPLGIGMIAGAYPALYLTAFRPSRVLKGELTTGSGTGILRKVLVTFQLAVSISLIAGTAIVFHQLRYMSDKDLGFDKRNLLVVNNAHKMKNQIASFRDELRNTPGVVNAAIAMDMPGRGSWEDIYGAEGSDIELPVAQLKVDEYYIPTMDMQIITGRAFEEDREIDHQSAVINETAVRLFGWTPEEALNQSIVYAEGTPYQVIGVVNDFHTQSLHQNIMPLLLFHNQSTMWGSQRVVAIRYENSRVNEVLQQARKAWDVRADQLPFEYAILDEELSTQYAAEQQMGRLTSVFSGFAILVAILGLMGLVAYSAEQRQKEIGIRKVLGASVLQIFVLINAQYLKLLAIALLFAVPVTVLMMSDWLTNFAFQVSIGPGIFVLALMTVAVLAFASVSALTLRASLVDPARVLKDE